MTETQVLQLMKNIFFTMHVWGDKQLLLLLKKYKTIQPQWLDSDTYTIYNPSLLYPHAPLPLPLCGSLLAAAASCWSPPVARGGQVLVHSTAVGDKTHAKLEVSGQATVGSQSQDQQGGQQQETHDQKSHTAPIIQQVWAVQGGAMRLHLEDERKGWVSDHVVSTVCTIFEYQSVIQLHILYWLSERF